MTDWKTTIWGALVIVGVFLYAGLTLFDGDPETNLGLREVVGCLTALAGGAIGVAAASAGGRRTQK